MTTTICPQKIQPTTKWMTQQVSNHYVKYKVVEVNKFTHKVILIIRTRNVMTQSIVLVRDNRIHKITSLKRNTVDQPLVARVLSKHTKKSFSTINYVLGAIFGVGRPVYSKNIGALWKKYNVPSSVAKFILEHCNGGASPCEFAMAYAGAMLLLDNKDLAREAMMNNYANYYTLISAYKFKRKKNEILEFFSKIPNPRKKLQFLLGPSFLFDSIRSVNQLTGTQFEPMIDWSLKPKEFHDHVTKLLEQSRNAWKYEDFPYTEQMTQIIEQTNVLLSEPPMHAQHYMRLKLAQNGVELSHWGKKLHHCIGSYSREARNGAVNQDKMLLGVYTAPNADTPEYCIETDLVLSHDGNTRWNIRQFNGLQNRRADQLLVNMVNLALNRAHKDITGGVISCPAN